MAGSLSTCESTCTDACPLWGTEGATLPRVHLMHRTLPVSEQQAIGLYYQTPDHLLSSAGGYSHHPDTDKILRTARPVNAFILQNCSFTSNSFKKRAWDNCSPVGSGIFYKSFILN